MEILQHKISADHNETYHYNGVIAYGLGADGKAYVLCTQPDAEMRIHGIMYVGDEIVQMSQSLLFDDDTEVDIHVDCWFVIARANGQEIDDVLHQEDQDDDLIFDNYDDGMVAFKEFLNTTCLVKQL